MSNKHQGKKRKKSQCVKKEVQVKERVYATRDSYKMEICNFNIKNKERIKEQGDGGVLLCDNLEIRDVSNLVPVLSCIPLATRH